MREALRTAPTSGTCGIRDRHVRQFETIGMGRHPEFLPRLKLNWPVCQLAEPDPARPTSYQTAPIVRGATGVVPNEADILFTA